MIEPSNSLLRATVDSSVDAILVLDRDGVIRFFNPAAELLFGYAAEALDGLDIHHLIPDDAGLEPTEIWPDMPTNLILAFSGLTLDVRGRASDGSTLPLEVTVSKLDEAASEGHYALIARDVRHRLDSERQRQQLVLQLAQSQKLEAVGQLAAGIAHEINTPTQYVGDNLQFLQESFECLVRVSEACRRALGQAAVTGAAETSSAPADQGHGEDLVAAALAAIEDGDLEYLIDEVPRAIEHGIDGIAQISKIVSAMKAFCHPGSSEHAPLDLNLAVENTLAVCRNEWKYAAEVSTDLDPSMPRIPGNENEIKQVLLNLVVNAAHAITDHPERQAGDLGAISIRTLVCGDWAEVRIADNGHGIPEDVRSRMFDPFFTTKEVGRGTGQGLAITRTIVVDNHRGQITVDSTVGQGSEFVVRLPLDGVR